MSILKNKLTEELHIDGAQFLGSGYGFEVYKITTWQAADGGFVLEHAATRSHQEITSPGVLFAQNESVFNGNIANGSHDLYFFVQEGTNKVSMASVTNTGGNNLRWESYNIVFENYKFQGWTGNVEGAVNLNGLVLPLFLLPDIKYSNGYQGLIFRDSTLVKTYNGFIDPNNRPENVEITVRGCQIARNAFNGYLAKSIILDRNIEYVESNAFSGYDGVVKCAWDDPNDEFVKDEYKFETIDNWSFSWDDNVSNLVWGVKLPPEEQAAKAERQRQKEEAERIEREFQTSDAINVLRYKEEGNYIVILGVKRRRKDIDIPSEINGKPVKKIAPFAFYNNADLEHVTVPNSVTEIGKAAFANCRHATINYPRTATVYSDAFLNTYSATPVR